MKFLAPEVVQTSSLDCGPACLKSLLEGFGIHASYGRLREACQTDLDGTSIDTIEKVAGQLGLVAEQMMVPPDHLLIPEAHALPAVAVVRVGDGDTHFVVIWKTHGHWIQVMDPAKGRRWTTANALFKELFIHRMRASAVEWLEWACTDESKLVLCRQIHHLGIPEKEAVEIFEEALALPGWRPIAALDATTRLMSSLIRSGGLKKERQLGRVLRAFYLQGLKEVTEGGAKTVPSEYWAVLPTASEAGVEEEQVVLRGAVMVRIKGLGPPVVTADLPEHLAVALKEEPFKAGREFIRLLGMESRYTLGVVFAAVLAGTVTAAAEAFLLRGMMDIGQSLKNPGQRLAALIGLLFFFVIRTAFGFPLTAAIKRLGRRLEIRLRVEFLHKIPRLGDRYFRSRPVSDMADRSHGVHALRSFPAVLTGFVGSITSLLLTLAGVIWIAPANWWMSILLVIGSMVIPMLSRPLLVEKGMRIRAHGGALSRFYFDALMGLVAIRSHGAERTIRRKYEVLLGEWASANLDRQNLAMVVGAVQSFVILGGVSWILYAFLAHSHDNAGALLLVYWVLKLPSLSQAAGSAILSYPGYINLMMRLFEPLGAPNETLETEEVAPSAAAPVPAAAAAPEPPRVSGGVAISYQGTWVLASGNTILSSIDMEIPAGSHLALVGASGAGKSSMVGLLLGLQVPAIGDVLVDGESITGARLRRLRRETAWVDPTIQLWNRTFVENLHYGTSGAGDDAGPIQKVVQQVDIKGLLERMPEGLQTVLGEGGALVSGGEGQLVRLGRGMLRPDARLVVLDEPFRGLQRDQRRRLLDDCRKYWKNATLICITHDMSETMTFERVVVMEGGHIVEDGNPAELARSQISRYRQLLDAEESVRGELASGADWRRIWLEGGKVNE